MNFKKATLYVLLAIAIVFAWCPGDIARLFADDVVPATLVHKPDGDTLRVESGGLIEVKSGGTLEVESGGTLTLTGATVTLPATLSGTNLSLSGTLDADGQSTFGADGTKSTFTAAGALSVPQTVTAGAGVAAATGSFTGAVDIDGQTTLGADGTKSTFTATGFLSVPNTITTATGVSASTGSFSGAVTVGTLNALEIIVAADCATRAATTTSSLCVDTGDNKVYKATSTTVAGDYDALAFE